MTPSFINQANKVSIEKILNEPHLLLKVFNDATQWLHSTEKDDDRKC
jgi:hypothetical protein